LAGEIDIVFGSNPINTLYTRGTFAATAARRTLPILEINVILAFFRNIDSIEANGNNLLSF